ncbi:uncharacterized protein K460DRAFT_48512 [Cucurbitaria berberidis CBS 394.84]|uniref:Uncharacterized protein n=1 Tax=Cucurbitaria berberidis CBS 394.84 TaxID=1168544 RepID=A0A9P4GSZ7_9PLEO|nr:uncharacterized protein K460DRAFT_48512 [Cucurbitaria berberidis CBS 394.84]KAF1852198.1 hypothetical protein K460DRAFT_48512 [Cucurbitaria berberidis CBS 394.84]
MWSERQLTQDRATDGAGNRAASQALLASLHHHSTPVPAVASMSSQYPSLSAGPRRQTPVPRVCALPGRVQLRANCTTRPTTASFPLPSRQIQCTRHGSFAGFCLLRGRLLKPYVLVQGGAWRRLHSGRLFVVASNWQTSKPLLSSTRLRCSFATALLTHGASVGSVSTCESSFVGRLTVPMLDLTLSAVVAALALEKLPAEQRQPLNAPPRKSSKQAPYC